MTQAVFNQVSECCHRDIVVVSRTEFPIGGSTWGISYKVDVCEGCFKDCSPVDQCEVCGVVGCLGDCIVDISADDHKAFKEVPCKSCDSNGYHHGFGADGRDPDWCTACGGNGVDFVDISEGEE